MSSAPHQPLEFFFDRNLGKLSAEALRLKGWIVHPIHEHFPLNGELIPDEEWIKFGCEQGWILLTKDKKIRYRAEEIGALARGHLFCIADGNLRVSEVVDRFTEALPAIVRAVDSHEVGFWHIHVGGAIKLMWP